MLTVIQGGRNLRAAGEAEFKCTATVCYATGGSETDGLFKQLQQLLNQIAPWAGYKTIKVDGLIGADTMDRLNRAATWARQYSDAATFANALQPNIAGGKTYVAERIFGTIGVIENIISNLPASAKKPLATSSSGGGSSSGSSSSGGGVPATMPDSAALAPGGGSARWPYYVAGAVGGLGLLYAAFHFSKKSASAPRAPAAAMAGARGRRSRR